MTNDNLIAQAIDRNTATLQQIADILKRMLPAGSDDGEEHTITGYVVGLYNDKDTSSKEKCLFCYTDYFEHAAVTLYRNHIDMLPFTVANQQPWVGGKPEKANAVEYDMLVKCNPFTVRREIMKDFNTGEPLLWKDGIAAGKPRKFVSHINGQPVPRKGNSANSEDDDAQPAPTQQQQTRSISVDGNGHKPAPPPAASNPFDDEAAGAHNPVLHALGTAFYANQWSAKRKEFSKHFKKTSSKEWSASQTQSVIDGLEGHLWTAIYEIANDKGWNEERLDNITHKARKGAAMSDVSGVMLTHVYKAVQEAAVNDVKLPEGEGLPF